MTSFPVLLLTPVTRAGGQASVRLLDRKSRYPLTVRRRLPCVLAKSLGFVQTCWAICGGRKHQLNLPSDEPLDDPESTARKSQFLADAMRAYLVKPGESSHNLDLFTLEVTWEDRRLSDGGKRRKELRTIIVPLSARFGFDTRR